MMEEAYQDAPLYHPMYWVAVMPGTAGSSNSSPEQAIGTAIQYGSALGGPLVAAAGTILATPLHIKGGFDENYAETQERYLDNILNGIRNCEFGMTTLGAEDLFKELS